MSVAAQSHAQSPSTAFVGRQPIFLPNLEVFGYELLFRSGDQNFADIKDGDYATASVVLNTLTDIGLEVVTESKLAFINLTRSLLVNANLSCLPAECMVLEILEDIQPDETVLAAVRSLVEDGYTIALDDFIYRPELCPLIELADIVKIEFPGIPNAQLPQHISKLRELGVRTILAEKVETHEEFELCKELGCDLFQGYFFCRPQVLQQRRLESNVGSILRLIAKLQEPEITPAAIAEVLQTDANLSYKVLRFVNSAVSATYCEVESLEHATTLLGLRRIRSLASMMLLGAIGDDKPQELIKTALIRAKMCELIAENAGRDATERYFTVGLLSVMDAMLNLPMQEVIQLLPLSKAMNDALLHREGPLGGLLADVIRFEMDNDSTANEALGDVYLESLQWTAQFARSL